MGTRGPSERRAPRHTHARLLGPPKAPPVRPGVADVDPERLPTITGHVRVGVAEGFQVVEDLAPPRMPFPVAVGLNEPGEGVPACGTRRGLDLRGRTAR